jgi:hypothetical protein
MCKELGKTPSQLYGITHQLDAYFFDRAVTMFGMEVESSMQTAADSAKDGKAAQQKAHLKLQQWLDDGTNPSATKGRFRNPMARSATPKETNG